jgi:hypothetical protein
MLKGHKNQVLYACEVNKKLVRFFIITTLGFKIKKHGSNATPRSYNCAELLYRQLASLTRLINQRKELQQMLDLEGSCERYVHALLPYLG